MLYTALQILDGTYKFKTGTQEGEINGLKKVNIFVGQNNSGKSRFMRSIFSDKSTKRPILFRNYQVDGINNLANKLMELYGTYGNYPFNTISSIFSGGPMGFIRDDNPSTYRGEMGTIRNFFEQNPNNKPILDIKLQENLSTLTTWEIHSKIIYIPLLRGLKNPILNSTLDDIYSKRTFYDYFTEVSNRSNYNSTSFDNLESLYRDRKFEVFSGLTLYDEIKRMLLGNHEQREIVRNFELFLSENFFSNLPITLTPHIDDDVLYIRIGRGSDYPIYDLGDGIQSIIICTFPLFKYKNENALFFIEEPEIGIHPGMQRILLNTLTKGVDGQEGKHQIFFTTHSNHLLDIALDEDISKEISIYQFRDYGDEKHITNISQNKEVLDLLGARNSSIFLSNCIIWVEGISDRIYIKKWLELYQESCKNEEGFQKFEEDKNFSILEYGGGNVTHFNFGDPDEFIQTMNIDGINKNNFILADNDGYIDYANETVDPVVFSDIKKKRLRLRGLKKQMTLDDGVINFYAETPEIENLISYTQYNQYFSKYKGINWQLKPTIGNETKFNSKTISDDIGDILKNIFIELKTGKISDNFSKGKDISIIGDKGEIANRMTEFFTSFEELSDGAKILTKKLYEFIKANNSN